MLLAEDDQSAADCRRFGLETLDKINRLVSRDFFCLQTDDGQVSPKRLKNTTRCWSEWNDFGRRARHKQWILTIIIIIFIYCYYYQLWYPCFAQLPHLSYSLQTHFSQAFVSRVVPAMVPLCNFATHSLPFQWLRSLFPLVFIFPNLCKSSTCTL